MTKHLRLLMLALLAIICTGGVKAAVGDTYKLVTSVDELKAGDNIVIGCATKNVALGTEADSKRRKAVNVTISDTHVLAIVDGIDELTLEAANNGWYLKSSTGNYLTASSTSHTNLVYNSKGASKVADISFVKSTGNADIKFFFDGTLAKRKIQYNGTSGFFFSTSGTAVQIYKKQDSGKIATTTTFGVDFDGKTFTFTDGVLVGFTSPTATCTTAGTIAYSSSAPDIVTVKKEGELTFTNTKFGTATITATFTPNDKDKYAVSTATYTVINTQLYNGIADFKKAITGESEEDALVATLNLTDAVVTYVNGKNTYIQDATAGILIYGVDGFAVGDKFTGKVTVKAYKYSGLNEIVSWAAADDMVKATGVDIPVKEVTLAELQDDTYESMRVKVVGVTATKEFALRKATLKQGDATIELYDKVNGLNITANSVYDIIGYPGINKTTRQLTVWSQDNIMAHQEADKADPEIAFKETEKTVELKEVAIELSTLIDNPHLLPVTYTSSDAEVAEVSEGVIYMYKTGKVDITAKFAGNDTYNAAEKTLALTIEDNRADAGIHFDKDSYTTDINKDEFSGAVLVNPNNLAVTYTINSNDGMALIDEAGFVTYTKGVETSYVVTATFNGNDTYKPATATYTLNIEDPNYVTQTVTFDATVDKGTNSNTNKIDADKLSKNGITIYGERSLFGNGENYRFYRAIKDNTAITTISVDKGNIIKIEFTNNNDNSLDKLDFNNGYTYDAETRNSVWVGKSNSISFTTDDATVSATKITVTVKVPVAKDFTLDEKEVNEIEDWENSNVTVKRTFYKDGDWNTLCLPFDVSAEEVKAAFGSDAQLRQVDEANSKDNTVALTTATAIKAGVPYLIKFDKLAENADQPEEFNHTFEGVTLTKKVEYSALADFNIIFAGSYSAFTPEDFLKEYNTCDVVASMAAANTLKKVYAGTTIKGLRAVFGLNSSVQPQAVKVIIDGTATGIGDLHVDGATVANGRVYNLNGQCVGTSLEGLKAGVYIQNGKKVIINK